MSLRPGELFLKNFPQDAPVISSNDPKSPVVYRQRLTWKPEYVTCTPDIAHSVKSDDFLFGDQLLTAHLALENIQYRSLNLYLQVATENMDGIIGRVIVHVGRKSDPISDCIITKANVVKTNRWLLPTPEMHDFSYRDTTFTIEVDIEVMIIDSNLEQEHAINTPKICKDFGSLLSDEGSTDVTLKVDDTELRAHKFILGLRSPVLKAMLAADMSEGRTGIVQLGNLSVAAAEAFRSFIYMAWIEEEALAETAEELFSVAVMYDMPDLRACCEYALRRIMDVENVGRLLLLGCLHDAVKLKAHAFFFFKRNKTEVIASDGWKQVIATNPTVLFEAIMNIV